MGADATRPDDPRLNFSFRSLLPFPLPPTCHPSQPPRSPLLGLPRRRRRPTEEEPMGTPETSREPCPDRIFDDVGSAFGMGAVGGSAFHFIKGIYNSPNGHRLSGGAQFVRMNAPRVGGSFAVWGGLFSTLDCAMVYARQKEDPWNSIVAGAATGGLLSIRQGLLASGRSALVGGTLLALIEGASIMINRVLVMPQDLPPLPGENPGLPAPVGFPGMPQASPVVVQEVAVPASGSTEWLGGLFRRKQEEKVAAGGGDRQSEMLESFDTPSAPIPTFEYK